jgi:hypothetical protein
VDNLDRENLLQYNTKKLNNRVPLVITYSKALPNIHGILKKNKKILYNSEKKMKRNFDEPPIVSYKRDKNIKDILVHRKHNLQFFWHAGKTVLYVRILLNQHLSKIMKVIPITFKAA